MLNPLVKDAKLPVFYARRMETMGDRIRHLRIARGYTQPALGDLCGVSKSAVSQWEGGSTANIKLQAFLKLCTVLQTDPEYLIWGEHRSPNGEKPGHGPRSDAPTGRNRRPGTGFR
jgi:DNA-binding XRE family transcriptional regulator